MPFEISSKCAAGADFKSRRDGTVDSPAFQGRAMGFTLIEILVVLGIIALGWLWVPGLFNSAVHTTSGQFENTLEELVARARTEAIARQMNVAFGVYSDGSKLSVGADNSGNFEKIFQLATPQGVSFNKNLSSIESIPGVLAITSAEDGFWFVWWFDKNGKPVKNDGTAAHNGTLFFATQNNILKRTIADEGALLEN